MSIYSINKFENIPTSIILFLIFLVGIFVYANSLSNDFVWDDQALIQENQDLKCRNNLMHLFSRPLHSQFKTYYRPLIMVSYKLDYFVWKFEPFGYHLTSILIHIINSILAYSLAFTLFRDKTTSAICGFLFVLHPVLSESVNFVSSRTNLIVFSFLMLSFIFYVRNNNYKKKKFIIFSNLSFILSLFSNEIAIVFPLFLAIYEAINNKRFKNVIPFFVALSIYLILRFHTIPLNTLSYTLSHRSTLLTTPKVLFYYFKIILFPTNLHKLWQLSPIQNTINVSLILYALFTAALIAFCRYLFKTNRKLFLGISWFIFMLLPVSQAKGYLKLPRISQGWLYVPAIGIILSLSFLFTRLIKSSNKARKYIALILVFLIFFAYAILTMQQNIIWSNNISLFNNIIRHDIRNLKILMNLGYLYREAGDMQNSLASYNLALFEYERHKEYYALDSLAEIYGGMGMIYLISHDYKKATDVLEKSIKANYNDAQNHHNLAIAYLMQSRIADAIAESKKSIELDSKKKYKDFLENVSKLKL